MKLTTKLVALAALAAPLARALQLDIDDTSENPKYPPKKQI